MLAAIGNDGPAQHTGSLQRRERRMVIFPDCQPFFRDRLGFLHLSPQERCNDFAGQIGRADIDPCILVHMAAEKKAAVGALFSDDLGPFCKACIVDQECPALARDDLLVSWNE